MNKKSVTLKDLNEFARENGLSEETELFVFGRNRIIAVEGISTEKPSKNAVYTDIYLTLDE